VLACAQLLDRVPGGARLCRAGGRGGGGQRGSVGGLELRSFYLEDPFKRGLWITLMVFWAGLLVYVRKVKAGQRVYLDGPCASFTLGHPADRHVQIAGGIGITQIMRMIRTLATAPPGWKDEQGLIDAELFMRQLPPA
jgi:hypothetical protein